MLNQSILPILKNRGLFLLWLAYALSTFGEFFGYVAFLSLLQTHAGSGSAIAGFVVAQTLAVLFLSPFAGAWVDKYNRKHIMILSDVLRALAVALAPFMGELYQFYAIGFLLSAATVLFGSARSAVLPGFVEQGLLVKVNSFFALSDSILRMVGPAAAGLLIAHQGLRMPFWINASTYLASALLLSALMIPPLSSSRQQEGLWKLIKEGSLYIVQTALARILLLTRIIVALGGGIIHVTLIIFIKETMGWGDQDFGLALSTIAMGSFIGSLWLSFFGQRYNPKLLFSMGTLAVGGSFVGLALSPFFPLSLLILFVDGLADSCVITSFPSLAQRHIPNEMRGRFFGTSLTLFRASVLVSALIGGLSVDAIGSHNTLMLAGFIVALGGLFAFFSLKSQ